MSDDVEKTPMEDENPATRTRISKWVAFVLDDLIRVPGTQKRVGLDPILGLLPGVGDFFTSAGGLTLLAAGAKKKVPTSVYFRMSANWVLNALVGMLPFIGDLFSFWFKSNRRNYELMRAHLDEKDGEEAEKAGWGAVAILCVSALIVFTAIGFLSFWVFRKLFG